MFDNDANEVGVSATRFPPTTVVSEIDTVFVVVVPSWGLLEDNHHIHIFVLNEMDQVLLGPCLRWLTHTHFALRASTSLAMPAMPRLQHAHRSSSLSLSNSADTAGVDLALVFIFLDGDFYSRIAYFMVFSL